jgi:hypothetical protein
MNEMFDAAAGRHWEDADLLLFGERFDNAAYLAGYSVECALKALLQSAGVATRPYSHDVETLAGGALLLAVVTTPSIRRYDIPNSVHLQDLLRNWKPEMRYSPTGRIEKTRAQAWAEAARGTFSALVVERLLDGWRV